RTRENRVMAASRRTGVDLRTGEGLRRVLQGVDVIVHAASHPVRYRKVDLDGTRRIIQILRDRSDPPHLVYISIVGCDRNPYPYYRAKYACELVLERSGLPVTVVRATQFHTLVTALARIFGRGPLSVQPQMSFQSCDTLWVADRMVETALAEPPPGYLRAADLAGPERTTLGEAVDLVRQTEGKPLPRTITLPAVGGVLKAFAQGTNLPGPDAVIGGPGYREWLRSAPLTDA
ncbi:MAG TPA: NAD(P)H-binding protein, partial [Propionibacteriaceae bacterium]|nr:NAD(P)H-binding protein [Propionibacteriaceae bacterium]